MGNLARAGPPPPAPALQDALPSEVSPGGLPGLPPSPSSPTQPESSTASVATRRCAQGRAGLVRPHLCHPLYPQLWAESGHARQTGRCLEGPALCPSDLPHLATLSALPTCGPPTAPSRRFSSTDSQLWEVDFAQLELIRRIGEGAFGRVRASQCLLQLPLTGFGTDVGWRGRGCADHVHACSAGCDSALRGVFTKQRAGGRCHTRQCPLACANGLLSTMPKCPLPCCLPACLPPPQVYLGEWNSTMVVSARATSWSYTFWLHELH